LRAVRSACSTTTRALFEACASADKWLEIFPGSRHGAPTLRDPQAKAFVDAWLALHLSN
jgi:hypothetical protein